MDIHNAEYGVWRPEYKHHYYRGVSFTDVPEKNYYAFVPGKPTDDSQFPDLARLKDDQPPQTIVTFVGSPKNGQRPIRGTATDNRRVATVKVNGQPATSLRGDFSEWQVELPLASNVTQLVAEATDTTANVELRPHIITITVTSFGYKL